MNYKRIIGLSISAIMLTTMASTSLGTTVNAASNDVSYSISKENISPVANRNNESLRQIAKANGVDLSVVERLNDGFDPDESIPSGTPIYLPQNVRNENDFNEGTINDNTSLDYDDESSNDLLRLFGNPPVGNPYANVPARIKSKYYDNLSNTERAAKVWIAYNESRYNYTVSNGNVYGRFQLTRSYLNGDYSKENQEKTADRYVKNRYGSWAQAKIFWQHNRWY